MVSLVCDWWGCDLNRLGPCVACACLSHLLGNEGVLTPDLEGYKAKRMGIWQAIVS